MTNKQEGRAHLAERRARGRLETRRDDTTVLNARAMKRQRVVLSVMQMLAAVAIMYGWIAVLALVGE